MRIASHRIKSNQMSHEPKCLLAVPAVGAESPIKILSRDVLPHPFLPSRANLALEDTLNSTSAKREGSPGQANDAFEILTSFSLLIESRANAQRKEGRKGKGRGKG